MIATREGHTPAKDALAGLPPYIGSQPDSDEVLASDLDLQAIVARILEAKSHIETRGERPEQPLPYRHYSIIEHRLRELSAGPLEDELGAIRPSSLAVETARTITFKMAKGDILPLPEDVGTDRDGGIRTAWMRGDRFLELVCPCTSDEQPYLYHSEGDNYGIEDELSTPKLRKWVRWLEGAAVR